jgi:hypothetical protein
MSETAYITAHDRELITGTMRRWLDGEPVWSHAEIMQRWGQEFLMYRTAWDMNIRTTRASIYVDGDRSLSLYGLRDEAISEFGFGLPSRELIDALEQHQPIIEVGAGTGYFTALMRKRGIDVIGTDCGPGQRFCVGRYDPKQLSLQAKTAVRRYRDRTVFCSWPSLWHTWFRQALRAMQVGQKLIVIEEDACAEDSAWEYRDQAFEEIGKSIPLPAWPNLNDRASCWVKKRHAVMRPPTMKEETERREASWKAAKKFVTEKEDDNES